MAGQRAQCNVIIKNSSLLKASIVLEAFFTSISKLSFIGCHMAGIINTISGGHVDEGTLIFQPYAPLFVKLRFKR